ncbi:cupin domain-containing protein [Aquibacillus rhizosphaerae]|uniref:Cupin domain-containing protein n=1 Tax=Aquibacillus rhizosphaerae TaxID=3051431 RepID=A0ABT7L516_9BACI|nr:cupin domain-containing protein [Aquibacillus sp. LR5S19]MDL4840277.1 cupin domain-containing protein [Aquibacillus sp. LR5S19]
MANIGNWENVDSGVTRKIHEPGKNIMMMEVEFETGAIGAKHSHPHEQLTYCLKGKMEFDIEGAITILSQGESIHIPSDAVHGVKALEPSSLLDTFNPLREDLLK